MIVLLDSITHLTAEDSGKVIVSGSHGGVYSAQLVAMRGLRAVIFHDAGVGLDRAGIGGLALLDSFSIAAAAVSHASAEIGNAQHIEAHGLISFANSAATSLGVAAGKTARKAAQLLGAAPLSKPTLGFDGQRQHRHREKSRVNAPVWLLDSASLAESTDVGAILVTGSHGGIIKSQGNAQIKAKARFVVFNDAGVGCNAAGIGRLAALESEGVAAVTVSNFTARIGDARSTWETGIISHANLLARQFGAVPSKPVRQVIETLPELINIKSAQE